MILIINNKCEDFYAIMGKLFGSRIAQNETHDRIYDDNKKCWYVYMEEENPVAYVSVIDNVIKNVYCTKQEFLVELLQYLNTQFIIQDSIVTNAYINVYEESGLIVDTSNEYKNFVVIRSKIDGQ
ncbi:MAG: hypothetical protein ACI4UX_03875 [Clostridia bacterium]